MHLEKHGHDDRRTLFQPFQGVRGVIYGGGAHRRGGFLYFFLAQKRSSPVCRSASRRPGDDVDPLAEESREWAFGWQVFDSEDVTGVALSACDHMVWGGVLLLYMFLYIHIHIHMCPHVCVHVYIDICVHMYI